MAGEGTVHQQVLTGDPSLPLFIDDMSTHGAGALGERGAPASAATNKSSATWSRPVLEDVGTGSHSGPRDPHLGLLCLGTCVLPHAAALSPCDLSWRRNCSQWTHRDFWGHSHPKRQGWPSMKGPSWQSVRVCVHIRMCVSWYGVHVCAWASV